MIETASHADCEAASQPAQVETGSLFVAKDLGHATDLPA